MNKNNYNYTLNGISHEISLQSNIKIRVQPHHEKILISNKYMIKFINDLFEHYNIDYFLCGHTLLGHKLFEGVHLFSDKIELGIIKNNLVKLKKCEQFLIDNDFQIYFFEHFVIVETIFFENSKSYVIIYLIDDAKQLFLKNEKNDIYLFDFYDIFPIKQIKYEEFTSYVPNKINAVLKIFQFQLKTIIFKKLYFVNYDFLLDPIKKQFGAQEEETSNYNKPDDEIITWEQKKQKHICSDQSIVNQEYSDDEEDDDSDSSEEDYVNNIQQVLEMDNIIHKVIHQQQNNVLEEDNVNHEEIINNKQIIQEEVHVPIKMNTQDEVKENTELIFNKNIKEIAMKEADVDDDVVNNVNRENDHTNESPFYSNNEEEKIKNIENLVENVEENKEINKFHEIHEIKQIILTTLFTCCYYFYLPKTK